MGQTASPPPPPPPPPRSLPIIRVCFFAREFGRSGDHLLLGRSPTGKRIDGRTACEPCTRLSAHALTHAQSHTHAPINPSLSRDNCSRRRRRLLRSRLSSFPRRPSSSRRKSCVALSPPQPPPPLHLSHCICHAATRKNPAKADQVLIIQVPCPLSKPVLCNISVKLNFPLGISTRQPRTFI